MIIRLIALVFGTSLISCMPQYGMQPSQMGMQQPQMGMPPSQMGIPPPPPMGMTMGYGGQMMMTAPEPPYQKTPKHPIVYAPLPGKLSRFDQISILMVKYKLFFNLVDTS